ncbi:MAG: class I SAM-dependent methyltransferase [Candidatus Giovannonibacteria bacterium]|nr:class I SAM-dependent methyltransferase [Candidatus Giovannonibacteria bacterium]
MQKNVDNSSVGAYYDAVSKNYHKYYDKDKLYDPLAVYPADYFRLQLLLKSFADKHIKSLIEVGVGEGTPLITLAKATDMDVWGFDISKKMVEKSKENMRKNELDPEHIFLGDIQNTATCSRMLKNRQFDGLMALGVMPHVENDDLVLQNMATLVCPGGSVFIEFRNSLFSLFTFNRYTADFILNELLYDVDPKVKEIVAQELKTRLRMDLPLARTTVEDSDAPGYDAILSKFHNPFTTIELFKKHNFADIILHWYHYHPAMPYLSEKAPELFRKAAISLEHETSGWRGMFLCSAFVIEAVKR